MSETAAQEPSPVEGLSIFKNLTIVFLVLNAAFLYLVYAAFMGVDIGIVNPAYFSGRPDPQIILYIHALAAILGGSYLFMICKQYGVSLTLAVLPQFAFIGALGAVLL